MDEPRYGGRAHTDRLTELILDGMSGQAPHVNVLVYDYGGGLASAAGANKSLYFIDTTTHDISKEREALCATIDELDDKDKGVVPPEFMCPITLHAMRDPVVACDGHTYERSALVHAFRKDHPTSPLTREPIRSALMYRNYALSSIMSTWATDYKVCLPTK
eukprot:567336-Prymnesium_polylepis.1